MVDFLTYVLVPVVALWRSDLMPTEVSFWIGLVVTIASALYFADMRMKTDDLWFRGFPATWNILVLYLFLLRPPWILSAVVLLGGGGDDVRASRLRASAAGGEDARADDRDDCRVVRLRGDRDLRRTCRPPVWVVGGLVVTAAYFLALPLPEAFALGARLNDRPDCAALPRSANPCYRPPRGATSWAAGLVAEWLRRGLQILAPRFDSGRGLHQINRVTQLVRHRPRRTRRDLQISSSPRPVRGRGLGSSDDPSDRWPGNSQILPRRRSGHWLPIIPINMYLISRYSSTP